MTDAATSEAFSLLQQAPILGIFVLALGVMAWIHRHWQAKETREWREWAKGEREAFTSALNRVADSNKEDLRSLSGDIKEALGLFRQSINDLSSSIERQNRR